MHPLNTGVHFFYKRSLALYVNFAGDVEYGNKKKGKWICYDFLPLANLMGNPYR